MRVWVTLVRLPHPQASLKLPNPMAYCDRCKLWFARIHSLEQHREDSRSHWLWDDCDFDGESQDALRQHYIQSPNHYYCDECDQHFKFEVSRRQHMDAKHWYCRKHDDQIFMSEPDLQSHYRQSLDHHFCSDCEKDFDDEDQLGDHLIEDHYACNKWLCCLPLFRRLRRVWVPKANAGERRRSSGGGNGASRGRAQGARGYRTL